MDYLFRDFLWRVDHMAAEQWCIVSLLATVACYFFLRSFSSVYRL